MTVTAETHEHISENSTPDLVRNEAETLAVERMPGQHS